MMEMMKAMLAEIKADRKAHHEEMMAMMDVVHKKMLVGIDTSYKMMTAWLTDTNDNGKETMACLGKTEARLEEDKPASVDTTPEVAQNKKSPWRTPQECRSENRKKASGPTTKSGRGAPPE
jgi:hypothetical protein